MNSMENQSKPASTKPGPLCSKRAASSGSISGSISGSGPLLNDFQTQNKSKRMENEEDDIEIQEESFTPSNGSYNKKLGIFTNKSTSSEGSGKLSFLFLVKVGVIVICILLFFSITMTKV